MKHKTSAAENYFTDVSAYSINGKYFLFISLWLGTEKIDSVLYAPQTKEQAQEIVYRNCIEPYHPYERALYLFDGSEMEEEEYKKLAADWAVEVDRIYKEDNNL